MNSPKLEYEKPQNFADLVNELKKFNYKICLLFDEVAKNIKDNSREPNFVDVETIRIKTQDARVVCLSSIQACILSSKAHLNFYLDARRRYKDDISKIFELFDINILDPSNDNLEIREETTFGQDRKNFSNLIFFSLDAFFYNLCNTLNLKNGKDKNGKDKDYSNYTDRNKAILKKLKIKINSSRDDNRFLHSEEDKNSFLCLANIRNSSHNNGIHRNCKKEFKIGETEYLFDQNQAIECASWHHTLNVLDSILHYLKKVLEHDLIKSKKYIKDDFAYRYENNPEHMT